MLQSFRLDSRGVRQVLKSEELSRTVNGLAGAIAAHVRPHVPQGTVVSVHAYTTDRGAASVTVEDVRAMSWQARDGILTRAAGEVGLEVKAWQQ
ncbi:hypothetical protein [Streptomyces sp. NBC_00557]|uniref:hypothetical protein n=1 Tax=Streptomyces sp. NBC_00557 TaxID=2975776 RepID=UPI002E813103|nr:hypothetical protein [Streptomyces sp. NBC_00557]WUC36402.1 hypothetical protein OG956_20335 [Streptomyces sp. NBC_00557]